MSKPVDTVNPVDVLTVTAVEQWQSLFQRIRDPLVAAVLVETLESDSSLKKQFAPAYALARETLARDAARRARAERNRRQFTALVSALRTLAVKTGMVKPTPQKVSVTVPVQRSDEALVWPTLNLA